MTMRLPVFLPLLWMAAPCLAWDTRPHQQITQAALDTLPSRFGAEAAPLVEIYCMLPDRYLEMERFGFVRKSPGPRDAGEIKPYCVRPDGQPIHGVTGNREQDTASLVYLFERIVTTLDANRSSAAARYTGVLAHFIADSLSPPHAVTRDELDAMVPKPLPSEKIDMHAAIERSIPPFTLDGRRPRAAGTHILTAAETILDQIQVAAARNRRDLPRMVKATCAHDELALNADRLRAGVRAAEILADALGTLFRMGEAVR